MQRILASVAISFSALIANSSIVAAPADSAELQPSMKVERDQMKKHREAHHRSLDAQSMEERRRLREQRGMKRLQQMKWQTGYVMPQHYRSDGYKVEYKEHNLEKPERNQQWYKINSDYILLDSETHSILEIKAP
jgi:Ni/Co efflux regulator RcnB